MKLKNVSASQLKTFRRCNRKWHWERIGGFRGESTPSQRRGTAIHHALELYLKTGTVVGGVQMNVETGEVTHQVTRSKPIENKISEGREWWETGRFVKAAMKYLPKPACDGGPETMLEEWFELPTLDGKGPPWLGVIDLLLELWSHDKLEGYEGPNVTDYKSTSEIRRYAATPAELEEDPQAISYALFVFENAPDLDEVAIRWLYLETRNKVKVNTLEVPLVISRDHAEAQWRLIERDIEEMVELAADVKDSLEVTHNPDACEDYGGCPHKERCGLNALGGLFGTSNKKEEKKTMGFLSSIKKQVAKTADEPGDSSILPDDAPDRTTSDEEAKELTPKGKKKKAAAKPKTKAKDKPKAEEKPPAEKKTRGRPKGSKNKKTTEGFTLFVDCMPVKGGEPYVNFEDWLAPTLATLNAECEKETGKPSFWLLGFGEQKAAIATAINAVLTKGVDTNIVVMSSDPYARDVLPLLIPHADMVVRRLGG